MGKVQLPPRKGAACAGVGVDANHFAHLPTPHLIPFSWGAVANPSSALFGGGRCARRGDAEGSMWQFHSALVGWVWRLMWSAAVPGVPVAVPVSLCRAAVLRHDGCDSCES